MSTAKAKALNIEHLHSSRKDEFMELCLPGPTVNTLAYLDVKFILSYPCFVHDVLLANVVACLVSDVGPISRTIPVTARSSGERTQTCPFPHSLHHHKSLHARACQETQF